MKFAIYLVSDHSFYRCRTIRDSVHVASCICVAEVTPLERWLVMGSGTVASRAPSAQFPSSISLTLFSVHILDPIIAYTEKMVLLLLPSPF